MITLEPDIESVLREGREAHIAVVSPEGPHVTPELYAWSGGRLWFWFAHTTLKSRVLADRPVAAAMVDAGDRSAVIEGSVDLIDVRRPTSLVGTPARGLRALLAAGVYTVRNAEDLGAFVCDLVSGRLGWAPPPSRVLASLEPQRATLAERSATGGEAVVVGLPGPSVAPGRWSLDAAEVRVSPEDLAWSGVAGRTPIAIVSDEYVAPGPAAKVGTLLRGTAETKGSDGVLAVDARTLTEWDGIDTETHRLR